MRHKTLLPLCFAAILLTGCTQYAWVKPIGNPETYPEDHYTCTQDSHHLAPPIFQIHDPLYRRPTTRIVHTDCHGPRRPCTRIIEHHDYPSPPQAIDLNQSNRNNLYKSCMESKGWVLQPIEGS